MHISMPLAIHITVMIESIWSLRWCILYCRARSGTGQGNCRSDKKGFTTSQELQG